MDRHSMVTCVAAVTMALGALHTHAVADEQGDPAFRLTIENSVLVVRYDQSARATSEQKSSQQRPKPSTAQQEANQPAKTMEKSVTVVRYGIEAAFRGGDTETEVTTTTTAPISATGAGTTALPPRRMGWTSARTLLHGRLSRAWSHHANPSWSYHPHSLAYRPKRFRGYQPRRDWNYHTPRRTGYRAKRDWTYHPR